MEIKESFLKTSFKFIINNLNTFGYEYLNKWVTVVHYKVIDNGGFMIEGCPTNLYEISHKSDEWYTFFTTSRFEGKNIDISYHLKKNGTIEVRYKLNMKENTITLKY